MSARMGMDGTGVRTDVGTANLRSGVCSTNPRRTGVSRKDGVHRKDVLAGRTHVGREDTHWQEGHELLVGRPKVDRKDTGW